MADRRIGGKGGGSDPANKGGAAKTVVVAGVLALGVATGGAGLGGGTVLSGSGGTGGSTLGQSLKVRTSQARSAARKGDAARAWRSIGLRAGRREIRRGTECVTASFGQVRTFLVTTPCRSLERILFTLDDADGDRIVVSVAWVGFRDRRDAREFRQVIDVHGSGDIIPLAGGLLDLAAVRFTGHHYRSQTDGSIVTIAETEPLSGHVDEAMLQAAADVAAMLPRP